jgi:hypothetical protein
VIAFENFGESLGLETFEDERLQCNYETCNTGMETASLL